MADKQPDTMVVNIPITVTVPLDVIARIKNECDPTAALYWVLTDVVNGITSAVKAIPYDITPSREQASAASSILHSPGLTPSSLSPPSDEIITVTICGATTENQFNLSVRRTYKVNKVKETHLRAKWHSSRPAALDLARQADE